MPECCRQPRQPRQIRAACKPGFLGAGSLVHPQPVRRTAEKFRTSRLPCVRGGGAHSAAEGLWVQPKRDMQAFLRLPSTPQSRQSRDSSPCTGEPRCAFSAAESKFRAWIAPVGLYRGTEDGTSPYSRQPEPTKVSFAPFSFFPKRKGSQAASKG